MSQTPADTLVDSEDGAPSNDVDLPKEPYISSSQETIKDDDMEEVPTEPLLSGRRTIIITPTPSWLERNISGWIDRVQPPTRTTSETEPPPRDEQCSASPPPGSTADDRMPVRRAPSESTAALGSPPSGASLEHAMNELEDNSTSQKAHGSYPFDDPDQEAQSSSQPRTESYAADDEGGDDMDADDDDLSSDPPSQQPVDDGDDASTPRAAPQTLPDPMDEEDDFLPSSSQPSDASEPRARSPAPRTQLALDHPLYNLWDGLASSDPPVPPALPEHDDGDGDEVSDLEYADSECEPPQTPLP
ncbi:hypothetical protein AURDEDRAFT_160688 [Auricularia subglabra TFB-10046 SS5]|nr:hypothetical protein AURDEDRAFT_160688 [Auricularia subglabra TFB-10046 SS5]